MGAVAVVVALVVVIVLLVLLSRSGPPDARDLAWFAGTGVVPDDEADVIRRYLTRHRRHRMVGGITGVVAAGIAGVRFSSEAPLPVLLFGGIAGVLVGTLSAESYRLGGRRGTAGVASLEPRDPAPLQGVTRGARILLAVSALGASAVAGWGHNSGPLALVGVGAAVTAVAEATRAQIVGRRRPVLSYRAQHLDAQIRAFAGRSVACLQLAAALLVAGGVATGIPGRLSGLDPRGVASLAAFVGAVVYLHRAAPRPPFFWRQPT